MPLKLTALRSSIVLSGGETLNQGCSFVRNMILARMLTKADFGIAATFAMIVMLLEFSAKLGVGQFVVRDKQGDDPDLLSAAHFVNAIAAVFSSLAIVVAARPIAFLLGLESHLSAVYCLAAIPILHGVTHLDMRRFERRLRFGPSVAADALPQVAMTLLAWPIAKWLPDYRAVLVLMIAKALLTWGASHALAERPYRIRIHRDHAARILRFGWPLVVNGFLIFLMMRGDQFVAVTFYPMAEFGAYAAAASLTMAPIFLFRRVFSSIALPIMAGEQDNAMAFNRRYAMVLATTCAFSAFYAVLSIVGAEAIMRLVFGNKYAGSGMILAALSAGVAVRNVRLAPSISALAKGDSVNQMISNFTAAIGLLLALGIGIWNRPIWMLGCANVVGESCACLVSFYRLKQRDHVPMTQSLVPACLVAGAIATAFLAWSLGIQRLSPVAVLGIAVGGGGLCAAAVVLILPASRAEAGRLFSFVRHSGWSASLASLKAVLP